MIVDFEKFNKSIQVIVPVLKGNFKYKGKRYNCNSFDSGWFNVKIKGNDSKIIDNVVFSEYNNFNFIKGYVFNEQFIFQSFEVGIRKIGREVMTDIYLNKCPSFSSIIGVIWEDGKIYFYSPNYKDSFIYTVKSIIENDGNIKSLKGLTPELRTLCLFYELEKQRLEELKAEEEIEKLKKTLYGRLVLSFKRTGAELIKYSISGSRIIVDWRIGRQGFNSVLDKNTFRVLECGYCCSNDDRRHNIHSMVNLAKDYDEQNLIYKTRER